MDGMTNTAQEAAENTAIQASADAAGNTAPQEAAPAGKAAEPEKEDGQQEPAQPDVKQLRADFEKEKAEAVKAALEEAAKKAAMKPEEVKEYEGQKREAELEKRERELKQRELRNDTKDMLAEKGLPSGFADFLMGDDTDGTRENVNAFKKEFDLAVQAQVEQRLKGTTPKAGSGTGGAGTGGMAAEIDKYL